MIRTLNMEAIFGIAEVNIKRYLSSEMGGWFFGSGLNYRKWKKHRFSRHSFQDWAQVAHLNKKYVGVFPLEIYQAHLNSERLHVVSKPNLNRMNIKSFGMNWKKRVQYLGE